jgi:nucleoside-diphosphate-sugar epimerase
MNVLVTGASGFVGVNIAKRLAERGASVVALSRQPPDTMLERFVSDVRQRIEFVSGDVRDRSVLIELAKHAHIDGIVHAAAMTPTLDLEQGEPASVVEVNFGGTLNVLEAARACGALRVVFVSSSGVYGAPKDRSQTIHEDQQLQITNLYTICKQASEHLCRRYHELFGLSTASGRLGSAFGPMERRTGSRQTMSALYTLTHAALVGRRITLYGADTARDFCYIEDVANAFAELTLADRLSWPVYNISAGTAHSLREACTALSELAPGFAWDITNDPALADITVYAPQERGCMQIRRLQEDVGFQARYALKSGLQRYLDWLHDNGNS